jgi:hypothetical protein
VLVDDALVTLPGPLPGPLQELLPADLIAVGALFGQLPFHHYLGSDTGVVGAGQPQGRLAHHPVPAGHDVLQRGRQGMAHVQLAGNVGRRHDNDERFLIRVYLGREIAAIQPELIPLVLYLSRFVGLGHLRSLFILRHSCLSESSRLPIDSLRLSSNRVLIMLFNPAIDVID